VNVVEVDPAGTVTEAAGTGRSPLLLEIPTAVPVDTALLRATVQVVEEPEARLRGRHAKDCSSARVTRLTVAVCDAPFRVAFRVALWLVVIFPAVAMNLVKEDPAETVTEAVGTGRSPLLLESATVVAVGAKPLSPTVQVVTCPELKLAGLHVSELNDTGATSLMVAVFETDPRVAFNVALLPTEPMTPAVASNEAEVELVWTLIDGCGRGSSALLLEIDTSVPPGGAGLPRVTVHVVTLPESRLVGLHVKKLKEPSGAATKLRVVVWGTPAGTTAEA
jgi:hypothetical protein